MLRRISIGLLAYIRFLGDIYALQMHVIVVNSKYAILICLDHN